MQQTGTGTGHWINMLVPKNSIKGCQKYIKVGEYWHGTIKNYRYDGDVSGCKEAVHGAIHATDGGTGTFARNGMVETFMCTSVGVKTGGSRVGGPELCV